MKALESLRTPKNLAGRATLTCDARTSRATDAYKTLCYKHEWCLTGIVTDDVSNIRVMAGLADTAMYDVLHTAWISPRGKRWSWQHLAWLLSRIRRVAAFFRSRPIASYQLKLKKKEQLPRRRLVTDAVTRWNTSYDMVGRFLEQPAICAAILSSEVRKAE